MNEIKVFENQQFGQLRTVNQNGELWFVAADVCKGLELGNTAQALARLDDEDKGIISNDTPGGNQEMSIVTEGGMWSLVLGSRKPEAKAFKRWVTHDIIPAIRQHGGYLTPEKVEEVLLNPDTIIRLATDLKAEQERRKTLEAKVKADAPKVMFAESVNASDGSILVGEIAKYLAQNGIKTGEKRLFERLRADGFLCSAHGERWNTPTQRAIEMGLFELKKNQIMTPDGPLDVRPTPKVTGRGQIYFLNKYRQPTSHAN